MRLHNHKQRDGNHNIFYADARLDYLSSNANMASKQKSTMAAIAIPSLQTNLTACRTSSSVFAETGAPDLQQLASQSSVDDRKQQKPNASSTESTSTAPTAEETNASTLKNDDDAFDDKKMYQEPDDDDEVLFDFNASLRVIRCSGTDSVDAFEVVSCITMSDFDILPNSLDFSQSIMPERRRRRRQWLQNKQQAKTSAAAAAPSRYRRPVDSYLPQKH